MGYIDIHSHILPQMDDGSQSMEQSLEMLRIAESEGITEIFATPHYKSGRLRADSREVSKALQRLQKAAVEEGLEIQLYPGTEIYYRSELEDKLDNGELHTMNGSNYVLVEFSPLEDYSYIRNAMDDILSMGYQPILAHVERYQCMLKDKKRVSELRDMGCGIQANAGSITGDFGFTAKHFLWKLLKEELIDYIGTDAHNADKRKPTMQKCADMLYKKCGQEYADALLFGNAVKDFLELD